MTSLQFSYDIGYASIGWSVIQSLEDQLDPIIISAGTVLFPKDDCLASQRRAYRRLRRNIRSTRQRMERLTKLFKAQGIINQDTDFTQGHMAPFFLANQVLEHHKILTGEELWHVLRWYAHNRGYDGNAQWSNKEDSGEDTEKVVAALSLMKQYGTNTVAKTLCAHLQLDSSKTTANFHEKSPAYKTLNVAFPRHIIVDEVTRIVQEHQDKIPGLTAEIAQLIIQKEDLTPEQRQWLSTHQITRLPKRYKGSLLFGQLIPRFDNRIIMRCPITWANVYQTALTEGKASEEAAKQAEKLSKVPQANTRVYYEYRLARILANIRVNQKPLSSTERNQLMELAKKHGQLTKKLIQDTLSAHHGAQAPSNLDNITMHPDSKKALILCPATHCMASNQLLKDLLPSLPEFITKIIKNQLKKEKTLSLSAVRDLLVKHHQSTTTLDHFFADKVAQELKKNKKNRAPEDVEKKLWDTSIKADIPKKRAPYAVPVLEQVVHEVLLGYAPSSPAKGDKHPDGEDKEEDGILYALLDPKSPVRQLQLQKPITSLTNNHMIRHRLLILERLMKDMVEEFADNDSSKVTQIVVEVGRELSAFSGMTAEEITSELKSRLRDFKKAAEHLQKHFRGIITGGLIRKCRIAMDLNWTCPFTGATYQPNDLPHMEKEHIIPFSKRSTNALSALVLTYPEVNKMKGARTAMQFIRECHNMPVEGKNNLNIQTETQYNEFVEKLDTKGYKDDKDRKKNRKKLLLIDALPGRKPLSVEQDEEKEEDRDALGFTAGAMTQSSHLMKLASKTLGALLPNARVINIPGALTGEIRKAWDVSGCLSLACPDIIDSKTGRAKTKDEIRGITDLHHALDAIVLGLTQFYIPGGDNGTVWQAIVAKYKKSPQARAIIRKYVNKKIFHLNEDSGQFQLTDLPPHVKNKIAEALDQKRIRQHVPADQSGAKLKETIWSVRGEEMKNGKKVILISQNKTTIEHGKRKRTKTPPEKTPPEPKRVKATTLVGISPNGPSKLKAIKGAIVINENYAISLDPEPTMITHFQVHKKLQELRKKNAGKPLRLLRKGMQINITNPKDESKNGIWVIRSIQDKTREGLVLDLQRKEINLAKDVLHPKTWLTVRIKSLLTMNLLILKSTYTG